ncbi:MAG: SdpI family protein [Spirochaetes bacterium]|nr:SdpI family protein [Spirochaetota bacterium]
MKLNLILLNWILFMLSVVSVFASPNPTLGFRIPATLKDPYVWKETNKRLAVILGFLIGLSTALLIFFGKDVKSLWLIELIFFACITITTLYLVFYTNSLLKKRLQKRSD